MKKMARSRRPIPRERKIIGFLLLFLFLLGCEAIQITPRLKTELESGPPSPVEKAAPPHVDPTPAPTDTPTVTPTPTITPTPTPTPHFLQALSMPTGSERALPRHGLIITFILPLLACGLPWLILEYFIVRYVQPRGVDLSKVLIKAQDGLFIEAAVSMTARRTLGVASTRMSWPRVRNFVEKAVEQELIHQALQFNTLEELERNLRAISEGFCELPIVHELSRDFGVEVLRFNIEIRYPPETVDALKRKADASAGGSAYLAYAAAAHLDPDTPESRHLYQIFQETSSQVDAARNLGGGISGLASLLGRSSKHHEPRDEEKDANGQ